MKTIEAACGSLLLFCFSACAEDSRVVSARLVKDELTRLSGASATNCGLIPLGLPTKQGWACALDADKSRRPFWLAFQEPGVDSVMWLAIGRDAYGSPFVLSYDSSPYGRRGLHPRLTRDICPSDTEFDPTSKDLGCRGNAP